MRWKIPCSSLQGIFNAIRENGGYFHGQAEHAPPEEAKAAPEETKAQASSQA